MRPAASLLRAAVLAIALEVRAPRLAPDGISAARVVRAAWRTRPEELRRGHAWRARAPRTRLWAHPASASRKRKARAYARGTVARGAGRVCCALSLWGGARDARRRRALLLPGNRDARTARAPRVLLQGSAMKHARRACSCRVYFYRRRHACASRIEACAPRVLLQGRHDAKSFPCKHARAARTL